MYQGIASKDIVVRMGRAGLRIVKHLVDQQAITTEQASWSQAVPLAADLCVEADWGGHTDMGAAAVLIPTIIRLRNRMQQQYHYA